MLAKSKQTMSLVSKNANRSPMLDSGVSNSPGILGMHCQSSDRSGIGEPVARDVKDAHENTASVLKCDIRMKTLVPALRNQLR